MTVETPSRRPPPPMAREKLVSIQLLRALAAATVAVSHIAFAFADHIGEGLSLAIGPGPTGQAAVMLFFVVSGYVITISSRSLAGRAGAARAFWTRRAVRIMPPYWIATLALLCVLGALWRQGVDGRELTLSLALIPFAPEDDGLRYTPYLWPGWTLFYELVFYALFGLALASSRQTAITTSCIGLFALVLIGLTVPVEMARSAPLLWTITRPVLLMFIPGIALAVLRERGWAAPVWLRVTALTACPFMAWAVPEPSLSEAMGFDYLAWCAMPALLLAFATLAGPLRISPARTIIRAGDASYTLYLFHVPVAWAWLWFYPKLPFFDAGAWDFLFTASAASFITAALVFAFVERPLTRRLNRVLGTRPCQTGALNGEGQAPHEREHSRS